MELVNGIKVIDSVSLAFKDAETHEVGTELSVFNSPS